MDSSPAVQPTITRNSWAPPQPISLFISSTFRDMQAERDALRDRVLPAVREFAAAWGTTVEMVDLRWGVDTSHGDERAQNRKVVHSCLAEIDRCRPFFIALLGNRYGYVLDAGQAQDVLSAYPELPHDRSLTELEIIYGLLAHNGPVQGLCCARTIDNLSTLSHDQRISWESTGEDAHKLAHLKEQLRQMLANDFIDYHVYMDSRGNYNLDAFCAAVIEHIEKELRAEWGDPPSGTLDPLSREMALMKMHVESAARVYVDRGGLIASLVDWCVGDRMGHAADGLGSSARTKRLILVQDVAGSGKTTVLARLAQELSAHTNTMTLCVFAGATTIASSPSGIMRIALGQLGILATENLTYETLCTRFAEELRRVAQDKRVILIVDALDQLAVDNSDALGWLSAPLPENCRVVASALPGNWKTDVERLEGAALPLPELTSDEIRSIALACAQAQGKELTRGTLDAIEEKIREGVTPNPLLIALIVQHLLVLDQHDFARIDQLAATSTPIAAMDLFMAERVRALPAQSEGVFLELVERVDRIVDGGNTGADLWLLALAFSRYGLREEDLPTIMASLGRRDFSIADAAWARQLLSGQLFQRDLMEWDFSHPSLRRALRSCRLAHDRRDAIQQALNAAARARLLTPDGAARITPRDAFWDREGLIAAWHAGDADLAAHVLGRGAAPEEDASTWYRLYLPALTYIWTHEKRRKTPPAESFIVQIVNAAGPLAALLPHRTDRDNPVQATRPITWIVRVLDRSEFFARLPQDRVTNSFREAVARAEILALDADPAPLTPSGEVALSSAMCLLGEALSDPAEKRQAFSIAFGLARQVDIARAKAEMGGMLTDMCARLAQTVGDFCEQTGDRAGMKQLFQEYFENRSQMFTHIASRWRAERPHDPEGPYLNGAAKDYLVAFMRLIDVAISENNTEEVERLLAAMEKDYAGVDDRGYVSPERCEFIFLYHYWRGRGFAFLQRPGNVSLELQPMLEAILEQYERWPSTMNIQDAYEELCHSLILLQGFHTVVVGFSLHPVLKSLGNRLVIFMRAAQAEPSHRARIFAGGISSAMVHGNAPHELSRMFLDDDLIAFERELPHMVNPNLPIVSSPDIQPFKVTIDQAIGSILNLDRAERAITGLPDPGRAFSLIEQLLAQLLAANLDYGHCIAAALSFRWAANSFALRIRNLTYYGLVVHAPAEEEPKSLERAVALYEGALQLHRRERALNSQGESYNMLCTTLMLDQLYRLTDADDRRQRAMIHIAAGLMDTLLEETLNCGDEEARPLFARAVYGAMMRVIDFGDLPPHIGNIFENGLRLIDLLRREGKFDQQRALLTTFLDLALRFESAASDTGITVLKYELRCLDAYQNLLEFIDTESSSIEETAGTLSRIDSERQRVRRILSRC